MHEANLILQCIVQHTLENWFQNTGGICLVIPENSRPRKLKLMDYMLCDWLENNPERLESYLPIPENRRFRKLNLAPGLARPDRDTIISKASHYFSIIAGSGYTKAWRRAVVSLQQATWVWWVAVAFYFLSTSTVIRNLCRKGTFQIHQKLYNWKEAIFHDGWEVVYRGRFPWCELSAEKQKTHPHSLSR